MSTFYPILCPKGHACSNRKGEEAYCSLCKGWYDAESLTFEELKRPSCLKCGDNQVTYCFRDMSMKCDVWRCSVCSYWHRVPVSFNTPPPSLAVPDEQPPEWIV